MTAPVNTLHGAIEQLAAIHKYLETLGQALNLVGEATRQIRAAEGEALVFSNAFSSAIAANTTTPTPPAPGQPWPGQGGIYGGVLPAMGDRPAMHMVFSVDECEDLAWGERGTSIDGATSDHDGRANTAALLASIKGGRSHPAAAWAAAYRSPEDHADYHLPSQAELFLAKCYARSAFKTSGWYWSSTQLSAFSAFVQDFEDGYSGWGYEDYDYRVRAVRWIPFST